ncbi:MAG: neutral zinc metallopeptidase, partial [Candidatus Acidiferrales bacterium]
MTSIPLAAWHKPRPVRFIALAMRRCISIFLSFFQELKDRFGASGEFAQAYVIAHELGHHVQKILGIESKFRSAQEQNPQMANQLSVKLELQADCLAG